MRSRITREIISHIVDSANRGATKTKIMYTAVLSYSQLNEYFSMLIENNLIEYLDGTNKFKTTEKGLFFLKIHNETEDYYNKLPQKTIQVNFGYFYFLYLSDNTKKISTISYQ
jgi:predicted transcriptional regulator